MRDVAHAPAPPEALTFGCRLNSVESDKMRGLARDAGLYDSVIVNTCAVTAEAERQAGQAIRRLKRDRPDIRIIVTGCAAHINPQKYTAMPEVDHVIGNDVKLRAESFEGISSYRPRVVARGRLRPVSSASDSEHMSLLPQETHMPHGHAALDPRFRGDDEPVQPMQRAFIQIQNGCDHRCTFCIIPFGRGASRSLTAEDIITQMRASVAEGFNEVVFTGVDIASYGNDLPDHPTLGAMMRQVLQAVPQLPRLRLSSLDPAAIDEDLWNLIADEPRLMPHLHLSLQAGDDMILKRMKRRHSRDDVRRLCDRARRLRPDMVFGADIIAGFPTETDAMFANTYNLAEQCGLTWLHVFPYSARAGTPAARMPQLHGNIRKERAEKLRALGEQAARQHHHALLGQTINVLVENNHIGCTPHFAKVILKNDAPVGHIVVARCVAMQGDVAVAEYGNAV